VYTRRVPFHDIKKDAGVLAKVLKNQQPRRPSQEECHGAELPDSLWDLMTRCWLPDADARPNIHDVMSIINAITF
jgi:hypothetical protein